MNGELSAGSPNNILSLLQQLHAIELGKIADLVVLDADPIADIHNTRRVQAVVLNGRFLSAAALTSGQ